MLHICTRLGDGPARWTVGRLQPPRRLLILRACVRLLPVTYPLHCVTRAFAWMRVNPRIPLHLPPKHRNSLDAVGAQWDRLSLSNPSWFGCLLPASRLILQRGTLRPSWPACRRDPSCSGRACFWMGESRCARPSMGCTIHLRNSCRPPRR